MYVHPETIVLSEVDQVLSSSFGVEDLLAYERLCREIDEHMDAHGEKPKPESQSRAKNWFITLNNYNDDDILFLRGLTENKSVKHKCVYVLFGREVCPTTGTKHIHAVLYFTERIRFNQVVKDVFGHNRCHIEVAKDLNRLDKYIKKDGDFEEYGSRLTKQGDRNDLQRFMNDVKDGLLNGKDIREQYPEICAKYPQFVMQYVQDHSPGVIVEPYPLFEWQQNLYEKLKHKPDNREILFLVDLNGNSGKSWFCHYYGMLHTDSQVLLPGKKADMAFILDTFIRVLFIDAPRSKQGEYLQYDFLEEVKNGIVPCPKYASCNKIFASGPPHVVVCMNEFPDMKKLSADRYHIIEVSRDDVATV